MTDYVCRGGEDGNRNVSAKTSGKWVCSLIFQTNKLQGAAHKSNT